MACDRYDNLCYAIGFCEDLDKRFAAAHAVADALYRSLPKDAEAFLDKTAAGLDISPVRQALANVKTFMEAQVARMDDPEATSPFERTISGGTVYVPERERERHAAWLAGAGEAPAIERVA